MEQFLKEQNRKFKNRDDETEINVVLGNETCNLDSAISSIIFAYFLYKVRNLVGITIPILNVKREDFLFRTDVIFFLERWNISITDLICIDEINLQILKEKGKLNLYLVAHSELSKDQLYLQETIVEAIDHRKVSNAEITKGYNLHIEHAASCCTIIAEEILKSSPDILDSQIALIFYTIILFQMLNQEEMDEVDISKDKKVAIKLEKYLEEPDKAEVHKELQKYVDDFNLNNHCFDESNSDDLNENISKEDNSNKVDLGYHIETVDFPDSPNHRSLLEIAPLKSPLCETNNDESEKKTSNYSEDHDLGIDSMTSEGSAVKKRIFANLSALENDEEEQRSLSSLSNQSNNENYSENLFDIDEDAETLNEVEDYLDSPLGSDQIPEISAREELEEERSWKTCVVNGEVRKIDMKVIEPFRKFLSHGGYEESTCNAIILLSACHLPDRNRKDYNYVMDNLFLYVVVTLDELVAEDYILIYLHGATESSAMPSFSWLKRCYQMIDRRLRKNLKKLYLVHPTFWLKAIVIMTRPFISAKFSKKLQFVYSLKELSTFVPLDNINIPEKVKRFDFDITLRECVDKWKSQSQSMYNIVYRAYTESLRLKNTGS